MDQLIFASLSHTHYWYEVGMLKVRAVFSKGQPGKVANPACGQLNRENEYFPDPIWSRETGSAVVVVVFFTLTDRASTIFSFLFSFS